ncbi:cytochrome P450 [Trichoderma compactum]
MGLFSTYVDPSAMPVIPLGQLALVLPFVTVALLIIYGIGEVIYNVFFHPLRNYPGPKLWAMSKMPYYRAQVSGNCHRILLDIHNRYGPVVRVSPNSLSYSHPDAAKAIRGHRKPGQTEHEKDPVVHHVNSDNIVGTLRPNHIELRRLLSPGFSHKAITDQQPIFMKYVDKLFDRLGERHANGTQKIDIAAWFSYTTFDIIGDLSFGESFDCLDNEKYRSWIPLVFLSIKNGTFESVFARFPILFPILNSLFMPKDLKKKFAEHHELSEARLQKRLSSGSNRPDFVTTLTSERDDAAPLTFDEIASHARVLIGAGSETSATTLASATYYLAMNPKAQEKLAKEVRSAFASHEEINLLNSQDLTYMMAVLNEAMRLFPAAPSGHSRVVGAEGDTFLGGYVPAGALVEVWQWPLFRNPAYWTRPNDFVPERWLGDTEFENDQRQGFTPFSVGPRNCIAIHFAYAEMRLILARLVWSYDITLDKDSMNWADDNKVYGLWEKGALNVYLKPCKME